MLFEIFSFNIFFAVAVVIALSGTLIAGIWDLLTTEIPDEIPYLMVSFGIFVWFIYMLTTGSTLEFLSSLFVGSIFLLYGYVLYKTGQWGGGDGALLAGLGFLLPAFPNISYFPVHLFINLYIMGAAWIVIYSLGVGIVNGDVRRKIAKEGLKKPVFKYSAILFIIFLILGFIDSTMLYASLLFSLVIFYEYGKLVEKHAFRRRIPSSQLKIGDVLAESKLWVGIGEEELKKIREKKRFVEIKEGVRFGLAFFLALLFTIIFNGSPIVNFYLSILF